MHQNYDNNAQYLNDCLVFIELLRAQTFPGAYPSRGYGSSRADSKVACEALRVMYADIRAGGRAALLRKTDIRLEKLVRKHQLDDIETQMLWIVLVAAVVDDTDLNKAQTIKKMILILNDIDPIQALKYWRTESRLIAKELVIPGYMHRPQGVISDLTISPEVLDRLVGRKAKREKSAPRVTTPAAMFDKLGEYVIGQNEARRTLATGIFKHLQICRLNRKRKGLDRIPKANIFMIGSTGTGKTHLCRTLARMLDLPMVICDATQYTETGYVGGNVESMLVALYEQSGKDLSRMENGIIYIDEIDKIAARNVGTSHNSHRDVSGLSVQQELLKLLDGEKIEYREQMRSYNFDVTNILFIVGGAFAGLEEVIAARLKQRGGMGFSTVRDAQADEPVSQLQQVTTEDILAYGFAPEFVGRFASVVALDPLGKAELVDIMTKPRNSLVSQYQELFSASGMDLQIPASALSWVADQAMLNKTGARGLKAILEKNLSPILYEQGGELQSRSARPPLRTVVFKPESDEPCQPIEGPAVKVA